jgi:triosephosphate isomerase
MKKFIAGNWKMHKNKEDAIKYLDDFKLFVKDVSETEIVLGVPFTLLETVSRECKKTNIKIAAQNMSYEESGALTGEISANMICDFAEYVIIGHSERRKYFHETNEIINKKINIALKHNLKVKFCLGETQEQRNSNQTNSVIETQFREALSGLNQEQIKSIVIAYEPVWAIGTGNTASPDQAEEVHVFIRELVSQLFNQEIAAKTRIIYGGSVKPENASEILSMPNINGCLPGGASLDPSKFSNIIKS